MFLRVIKWSVILEMKSDELVNGRGEIAFTSNVHHWSILTPVFVYYLMIFSRNYILFQVQKVSAAVLKSGAPE